MSRSEFRYNRKRKHYSYLFKDVGSKRKNIILSSKPVRKEHKKIKRNVKHVNMDILKLRMKNVFIVALKK